MPTEADISDFISRWQASGSAERANYQLFLCELCDVPKTRAEAIKGLDHMAECLGEGRGLAGKEESEGWDGAVRDMVKKKLVKMQTIRDGLQSPAEAAASGERDNFDPTRLTRYGYLTWLGQGLFGRDG